MKKISIAIIMLILLGCGPKKEPMNTTGEINDPDLLFRIALDLTRKGELKQASAALLKAEEIDSKNSDVKSLLGFVYMQEGESAKAESKLKESLEIRPSHTAYINLAQLYITMSKWDFAIDNANKALEDIMYFTPYEAYNIIGWAYYNKKQYDQAKQAFSKALKTNSSYVLAMLNLALTYVATNKYDLAKDEYERIINTCGDNCPGPFLSEFYYRLGMCHLKLKDKKNAKVAFEKSIEIDPTGEFAKLSRQKL